MATANDIDEIEQVGGTTYWNHVKTFTLVGAVLTLFFCELIILVGGGAFAQHIASELGDPGLIAWPALVVIIFTAALAPPLSQAADYWGRKWILIIPNIGIFAGALISSRATSMGMYVAGFAVGGFGFGSQGLILAVVSEVLPRKYRSWAQASANVANALGSIFSLALGGYLVTSRPYGFRIYFYICAAIAAVSLILVALLYNPPLRELQRLPLRDKFRALDWPAYFLLGAGTILFCVGLLNADNPYKWTNSAVLVPLIVGAAFLIALGFYSWKVKKDGLFHHDLFRSRNFLISNIAVGLEGLAYVTVAVFYPYALEVLESQKQSLYQDFLAEMVGFCAFGVACIAAGYYIYRTKSVRITGVLTFVFFTIFMALMSSVTAKTAPGNFWGYILFYGIGLGFALVTFFTAAQLSAPAELIATTTGIISSIRSVGGSIGLAIENAIFASGLSSNLVPNISKAVLAQGLPKSSLVQFIEALTANDAALLEKVPGVNVKIIEAGGLALQEAYAVAFSHVFIFGAAMMAVGIIMTAFSTNPKSEFTPIVDAPLEVKPHEKDAEAARKTEERVVATETSS